MKAEQIRENTVETLQQAVVRMMSLEWDLTVEKLPIDKQVEALMLLARTNSARVRLENAKLRDIAAKLKNNERSLEKGTQRVAIALGKLKKVARVVSAVNGLLKIVTKIV